MKKKFKNNIPKGPKGLVLGVIFFVACMTILTYLNQYTHVITTLSYSDFSKKISENKIKGLSVSGSEIIGTLVSGEKFQTRIPANDSKIWEELKAHNVEVYVSEPAQFSFWQFFFITLIFMIVAPMLFMLFRQLKGGSGGGSGGGAGLFSFGKSKAKMFLPSQIKDSFKTVAGLTEAKEELKDVVDYLKHPEKYKKLGAKIPAGILLVGEPGNGKTLLARAVAGEANCPFFSISGSDFIEVFVGVGAARVRDLFAQARKVAPCIVFIDEIDAVGRHRGSGMGGGNDEREQTLNQLLTEMDGFDQSGEPIIIMGATNRPDILDKALLRPGRFDRQVTVPYPDLKSRLMILEIHAKNIKAVDDLDLTKIAQGTPGFSGADLANLINEAAIIASNKNKPAVDMHDIEEARDKILLGKEIKTMLLTPEDKKITAYHEAGHALIRLLHPQEATALHKVTIIPRGRALGVTHSLPEREKYNVTKKEILADIEMALGGRIAEELVFNEISSGAASDFRNATALARRMVCDYGMTDALGEVVYAEGEYSSATGEKIDNEIRNIINICYENATGKLKENREKLDKLANALLDKETMYASEIYELLGMEPRKDFKLT